MCSAITYGNGVPAPCAQTDGPKYPFGLCYYHDKMRNGHIAPLLDGVSVKTADGVSVHSATRTVKSK